MSATAATGSGAGAIESINPATLEPLGRVETTAPAEIAGLLDAVADVQPLWAQLRLRDRGRYMRRA